MDLKEGDRIRLTVEGEIQRIRNDGIVFVFDNDHSRTTTVLTKPELSAPTCKLERILQRADVGDQVVIGVGYWAGFVCGIEGADHVWVSNDVGPPRQFARCQITEVRKKGV